VAGLLVLLATIAPCRCSAGCTPESSVKQGYVSLGVSGGECLCPGFAAEARCPRKGIACGANGTLINYFERSTTSPRYHGPGNCTSITGTPQPCYTWCADLCEFTTACESWEYKELVKQGDIPQCTLFNHTTPVSREHRSVVPGMPCT
jgi:hypothetical protein